MRFIQARKVKKAAGILAAAVILGISCSTAYSAPTSEEQAVLDKYAEYIDTHKAYDFGYPANHDIHLTEFYKWYLDSHSYRAMVNNAGDPFEIHEGGHLNALKFERAVIDFFGPHYGFDLNNLWGLVTFSGTDGNSHGIYFGSKYLEKKTQKKLFPKKKRLKKR